MNWGLVKSTIAGFLFLHAWTWASPVPDDETLLSIEGVYEIKSTRSNSAPSAPNTLEYDRLVILRPNPLKNPLQYSIAVSAKCTGLPLIFFRLTHKVTSQKELIALQAEAKIGHRNYGEMKLWIDPIKKSLQGFYVHGKSEGTLEFKGTQLKSLTPSNLFSSSQHIPAVDQISGVYEGKGKEGPYQVIIRQFSSGRLTASVKKENNGKRGNQLFYENGFYLKKLGLLIFTNGENEIKKGFLVKLIFSFEKQNGQLTLAGKRIGLNGVSGGYKVTWSHSLVPLPNTPL